MQVNKINLTVTEQTGVGFDKHSDEEYSIPIELKDGYVEIFGTLESLTTFVNNLHAAVHNNKQ